MCLGVASNGIAISAHFSDVTRGVVLVQTSAAIFRVVLCAIQQDLRTASCPPSASPAQKRTFVKSSLAVKEKGIQLYI